MLRTPRFGYIKTAEYVSHLESAHKTFTTVRQSGIKGEWLPAYQGERTKRGYDDAHRVECYTRGRTRTERRGLYGLTIHIHLRC